MNKSFSMHITSARKLLTIAALVLPCLIVSNAANAQTASTVAGTDVIFIAGRTDFRPAPPGVPPSGYLLTRNGGYGLGPQSETFPELFPVHGNGAFTFSAAGTVNYDTFEPGSYLFHPDGGAFSVSISRLGGISGYKGPVGALVGVFLTDSNPSSGSAPSTLDFSTSGGTTFTALAPALGQVFFIGDGLVGTGSGSAMQFTPPAGATRLFLGLADAVGFSGAPGAYDDNAGSYSVTMVQVPEPSSLALAALGLLAILATRHARVCPLS